MENKKLSLKDLFKLAKGENSGCCDKDDSKSSSCSVKEIKNTCCDEGTEKKSCC